MDPLAIAGGVGLALLGGGLLSALVWVRRAPVDEATAVSQASTSFAGVVLTDNEDLRAQNRRLVEENGRLVGELAALRSDAAREREAGRQLREANEGLVAEIDFLHEQRHGREPPQ